LGAPPSKGWAQEVARGAAATFPLRAADLPELEGAALGQRLRHLRDRWLDSDLRLAKADLLG
jgi:poly(A) polymerase